MHIGPKSDSPPFIQEEMKVKQEESEKSSLPFDIVKTAINHLQPTGSISNEELRNKIKSVKTDTGVYDSIFLKLTPKEQNAFSSLASVYSGIDDILKEEDQEKIESLIEQLIELGDLDKAIEIAKSITDESLKTNCLDAIRFAYLGQGNFEKAFEIIQYIPDDSIKNFCYENCLDKLEKKI